MRKQAKVRVSPKVPSRIVMIFTAVNALCVFACYNIVAAKEKPACIECMHHLFCHIEVFVGRDQKTVWVVMCTHDGGCVVDCCKSQHRGDIHQ